MSSPYITHKQAAELLGVSPGSLYIAYCRRRAGLPPRYMFGRQLRYRRDEVLAAIKPMPQ